MTKSEIELINTFILLIMKLDPDIIAGYDCEKASLFYFAYRCWTLGIDVMNHISRSPNNLEEILVSYKFNLNNYYFYFNAILL